MKIRVNGYGDERANGDALARIFEEGLAGRTDADCGVAIVCSLVTNAEPQFKKRHGRETDLVVSAWFDPPLIRMVGSPARKRSVKFDSFCAAIEVKECPVYDLGSAKPWVEYEVGKPVYPANQAQASGLSVGTFMRAKGIEVFAFAAVWLRQYTGVQLHGHSNPTLATFFGGDAKLDDVLAAIANCNGEQSTRVRAKGGKKAMIAVADFIAPSVRVVPPPPAKPIPPAPPEFRRTDVISVTKVERPIIASEIQRPSVFVPYSQPIRPPQYPANAESRPYGMPSLRWSLAGARILGALLVALLVAGVLFKFEPRHARHHATVAVRHKPKRVVHVAQAPIHPPRVHRVKSPPSWSSIAAGLNALAVQGATEHGNVKKAEALARLAGVR